MPTDEDRSAVQAQHDQTGAALAAIEQKLANGEAVTPAEREAAAAAHAESHAALDAVDAEARREESGGGPAQSLDISDGG